MVLKANFKNNTPDGVWKVNFNDGRKSEITYKDGKQISRKTIQDNKN